MNGVVQDIRYALRALRNRPGLTIAAVLCLGLGIGVNASLFNVVDTLLFRAPPYLTDPGRVVRVYFNESMGPLGRITQASTSVPNFETLATHASAFEDLAAFYYGDVSLGNGRAAAPAHGLFVSAGYFRLLDARPVLGRFFGRDEDRVGQGATVVLGYGLWRRRFGGDTGVVGRTLRIYHTPFTIVGVAPEGLTGPNLRPIDLWMPLRPAGAALRGPAWVQGKDYYWIRLVGRLRPGMTRAQATEAATIAFAGGMSDAERSARHPTVTLAPMQQARGPKPANDASVALWLSVVAAIVFLIACANVANLLLARAIDRRREVAVRRALGAGGARIVRQFVLEAALLAAAGAGAALLASLWAEPVFRHLLLPHDMMAWTGVGWRVAGATAATALVAGGIAAILPALSVGTSDVTPVTRSGARGTTAGRSRLRTGLLVGQVALTLMLLAGVGLLVRSLDKVTGRPIGFEPDHVLLATMDLDAAGFDGDDANRIYLALRDRLRSVPGIAGVSASVGAPFWWSFGVDVSVPGRDSLPRPATGGPYYQAVTPDYFVTMGTPIVTGRGFTARDVRGAEPVAIVNATLARQAWPGGAIGRCLTV
ncbi:MAG TPA: ABC transporter permease, partial [Gemmatimonadales bacterium]|nr:ABC transporter permease [Gemmatimonadales bacterium]